MTIFNLLVLVLVLGFSTESMADSVAVFQDQCEMTLPSQEGLASSRGRHIPTYFPLQSYNELLLVLQWPTSFCNIRECDAYYRHPNRMPHSFTVHGLWFNMNRAWVCCSPPSRPELQIRGSSVEFWKMMRTHWPNLRNRGKPGIFWAYEYAQHGSCVTGFQTDQRRYFQKALDIANSVYAGQSIGNLSAMRLNSGIPITLQSGSRYHILHFAPVTIGSRTFYPSLRCNTLTNGEVQLQEIVFCTNTVGVPKRCFFNDQSCNYNNGWFVFP